MEKWLFFQIKMKKVTLFYISQISLKFVSVEDN